MVVVNRGRSLGLVAGAAVGLVILSVRTADACSFAAPEPFDDAAPQAYQGIPPTPELSLDSIDRGYPGGSSCSDIGSVALDLDPVEPGAGYRFELAPGSVLPLDSDDMFAADAVLPLESENDAPLSTFYFHWVDGADIEQEAFSFRVRVIPVGTDGEGAPSEWLTVEHPGRDAGSWTPDAGAEPNPDPPQDSGAGGSATGTGGAATSMMPEDGTGAEPGDGAEPSEEQAQVEAGCATIPPRGGSSTPPASAWLTALGLAAGIRRWRAATGR